MKEIQKNRLAFVASLNLEDSSRDMVSTIWIKYETGLHDYKSRHGARQALNHYKSCYE
jgi:hypothetical protein